VDQTVIAVAVIAAIPGLVATFAAYMARRDAQHAKRAADKSVEEIVIVHGEIRELGRAVDGRLTQLLKTSSDAARAEGRLEGPK
jgi:hypothetical protein